MHVQPLTTLSHAQVAELAASAADRGETVEHANPFAPDCWRHAVFVDAFRERAAELQPVC